MQPAAAAQYLQPRPFIIALVAATATLGDLGPTAYPHIYALVGDQVGIPHALPHTPTKSYKDILDVSQRIAFTADPHMVVQHSLRSAFARVRNVQQALKLLLDSVLRSPDGLRKAVELMYPQTDPAMHGVYEPDGVISCFLRKVCVAFSSLTFEALARLLHHLKLFIHPNPSTAISQYSTRDILPKPSVTRKAAMEMARGISVQNTDDFSQWARVYRRSKGTVMATNMGIQAINCLGRERSSHTEHPSLEYVMQLEAQRRKDFGTAIDALHRYFDLSIAEIGRASVSKQEESEDKERKKTETYGHQYAALSLGVLHAQFGKPGYAAIALDDTIRAAQHCGDEACQARALNWMARTCSSVAKRHQMLEHAGDQLALAREELCTVFTPVSDEVPDSVNLCSEGSKGADRKCGGDGGLNGAARLARIQARIDYRKPESRVDSLLMSAAAWESHASSPTALSVAKMALGFAKRVDKNRMSASKARSLVAVASLTALEGDYQSAARMLTEALSAHTTNQDEHSAGAKSTNGPELELISRSLSWLQFERALRQGDTAAAELLCKTLSAFAESAKQNSLSFTAEDLILDSLEAEARVQLTLRASQQAVEYAELLCRHGASFARPARVVEGLRLRAEAHLTGGAHDAALPAALAAVSLSQGLGLESAHVHSVLTLTETMLRMDEREVSRDDRALRALLPVLPQAMDGLGARARARALRLHSECLLSCAAGSGEPPRMEVLNMMRLGEEIYENIEDTFGVRDCAYLLARSLHWRGETVARNEAAKKFLEADKLLKKRKGCLRVKTG